MQKYEIWLQLIRGVTTIGEAADRSGVDRSTIMRLRTVAKEVRSPRWPSPSPASGRPGATWSWEAARAEAARLGEALKELAVKLVLVEGRGHWG